MRTQHCSYEMNVVTKRKIYSFRQHKSNKRIEFLRIPGHETVFDTKKPIINRAHAFFFPLMTLGLIMILNGLPWFSPNIFKLPPFSWGDQKILKSKSMVLCEGFSLIDICIALGWGHTNDPCFTTPRRDFWKHRAEPTKVESQGCFEANILKRLNSSFDSNDTSLGFGVPKRVWNVCGGVWSENRSTKLEWMAFQKGVFLWMEYENLFISKNVSAYGTKEMKLTFFLFGGDWMDIFHVFLYPVFSITVIT